MTLQKPYPVQLAENIVLANIAGSSESAVERLQASPQTAESVLGLIATAANDGVAAGLAANAPTSTNFEMLASTLRHLHAREMFGDCVEDGQPFPCRTIRALDIIGGPVLEALEDAPGA